VSHQCQMFAEPYFIIPVKGGGVEVQGLGVGPCRYLESVESARAWISQVFGDVEVVVEGAAS
jgi:hypothetical protein